MGLVFQYALHFDGSILYIFIVNFDILYISIILRSHLQ